MNVTKAVVAVAGWGTRMLPVTKSIEKCMLPVGTRPVIDYVVHDIVAAGVKDIYFVVGEQSAQIRSYFAKNTQLEDYLRARGKEELVGLVEPPQGVNFHFITQPADGDYGTSVPVGLASEYIEDGESALVVMGDQFFYREDGGSNAVDLIRLVGQNGLTAGLYGNPVPDEDVEKFGIIENDENGHFVRIVEKPKREDAPSNLNNSGFYLFDKELFELAKMTPANLARGEYEVTDAINAYVTSGKQLAVGEVQGVYMDCGNAQGWHAANDIIARQLQ